MVVGSELKNKFQTEPKRAFVGLQILLKTSPHPSPPPWRGDLRQVHKKSYLGILKGGT